MAEASSDTSGEAVHEWRKRVKDHWYHLRLLRKGWPKVLKRTEKDAHALGDLLGDEHDLVVLNETLEAEAGTMWDPARADALRAIVDRRREELLAEAFPLGRRLYAEKPARFTTRIRRYWDATRSEAGTREEPAAQAAGA